MKLCAAVLQQMLVEGEDAARFPGKPGKVFLRQVAGVHRGGSAVHNAEQSHLPDRLVLGKPQAFIDGLAVGNALCLDIPGLVGDAQLFHLLGKAGAPHHGQGDFLLLPGKKAAVPLQGIDISQLL